MGVLKGGAEQQAGQEITLAVYAKQMTPAAIKAKVTEVFNSITKDVQNAIVEHFKSDAERHTANIKSALDRNDIPAAEKFRDQVPAFFTVRSDGTVTLPDNFIKQEILKYKKPFIEYASTVMEVGLKGNTKKDSPEPIIFVGEGDFYDELKKELSSRLTKLGFDPEKAERLSGSVATETRESDKEGDMNYLRTRLKLLEPKERDGTLKPENVDELARVRTRLEVLSATSTQLSSEEVTFNPKTTLPILITYNNYENKLTISLIPGVATTPTASLSEEKPYKIATLIPVRKESEA